MRNCAECSENESPDVRLLLFLILAAVICLWNLGTITAFKYAFVGDEWALFDHARKASESHFLMNPFAAGVYDNHAAFASMLQGLPMAVFGETVQAWKSSNVLCMFLSGLLVFLWARSWFGSFAGFIAGCAFITASYPWEFGKVGYPSHLAMTHLALLHVLFSKLVRRDVAPGSLALIGTGILSGFAFYLFGGMVYPIILSPYALFLLIPRKRRFLVRSFAVIIGCGLLIALPGFLDSSYMNSLFGLAGYSIHPLTAMDRVWNALGYLYSFAYMTENSHFAYGPYCDLATRIAVTAGVVAAFYTIFQIARNRAPFEGRNAGAVLILMCTVLTAFSYGLTTPYPEPPRTRGLFIVLHYCALAGLGASFCTAWAGARGRAAVAVVFVFACLLLNSIRSHQFFVAEGITPEACILRKIQKSNPAADRMNTVYLSVQDERHFEVLDWLLSNFHVANVEVKLLPGGQTPPEPSGLVIEMEKDVYSKHCRDLAQDDLPEFMKGLNFSSYWW